MSRVQRRRKAKSKLTISNTERRVFLGIFLFSIFYYVATEPFSAEKYQALFLFLVIFLFASKTAQTFVFSLLRIAYNAIFSKSMLPISLSEIDLMDGKEFENCLKPIFERQGYHATVTQGSGDFGADLVLQKGKKRLVVQAKRYSSNIGVSAVQEVVASIKIYKATGAMVVTNQYFTKAAIRLAKANGVTLVDRDKLSRMLI